MIMEAMRLSVIDHEEHQRSQITPDTGNGTGSATTAGGPNSGSTTPTLGEGSSSTSSFRRRAGTVGSTSTNPTASIKDKATSKLFSKFGNRSRSGSNASNRVTFAPETSRRGSLALGGGSQGSSVVHLPPGSAGAGSGTDFAPNSPSPLVSTTTNTSTPEPSSAPPSAIPRISLDMAPMAPEPAFANTTLAQGRGSVDTTRTA